MYSALPVPRNARDALRTAIGVGHVPPPRRAAELDVLRADLDVAPGLELDAPREAVALAENAALMRQMGVPTEALDAEGVVVQAQPFVSPEGIGAAASEPQSGFADY